MPTSTRIYVSSSGAYQQCFALETRLQNRAGQAKSLDSNACQRSQLSSRSIMNQ
ncbi:hypothetical protein RAB80_001178 [Fusarium oxysporum f. sp. vasinfectum]|nr:hypothetical protein RAB80_001178 [Fusarium oxysporum f. sp. vasinfectum]